MADRKEIGGAQTREKEEGSQQEPGPSATMLTPTPMPIPRKAPAS